MRDKLRDKEFGDELIDQVVADLERLHLLDDRAFARGWIESRMRNRPSGTFRLARELHQKGIDKEIVDELLEEFGDELDSAETAAGLLRRQGWRYTGLEEMKAKLKPKKTSGVSAEMLDTANSYDDKVAVIRMIVSDEAARVSNVFKAMMQDEMDKS